MREDKQVKKNLIITASDRKYGDFLIEHWLASLWDTNDRNGADIAVLDYGLSVAQRYYLAANNILVRQCIRDGHVTTLRYRDMEKLLQEYPHYEQILLCDSGDIIFQGDILPLFSDHPDMFRAVCEDRKPFFSVFITDDFFEPEDRKNLSACFIKNPMINGGFVLAPREKMLILCNEVLTKIKDKSRFGPDQIVLNGLLYRVGFHRLDSIYNYVIATAKAGVQIVDGKIYTADGRLPFVVHNAGNIKAFRPVENFGYGPGHNVLKHNVYNALKGIYQSSEGLFRTQEQFLDSQKHFKSMMRRAIKEIGIQPMRKS